MNASLIVAVTLTAAIIILAIRILPPVKCGDVTTIRIGHSFVVAGCP